MNFASFDSIMHRYEDSLDQQLPPKIWPLIRLCGRNWNTLSQKNKLQQPFDRRLHSAMVETAKSLMNSDFAGIYAYIENDEISVLFERDNHMYERHLPKWLSVIAGEASATFTHTFQDIGVFSARIYPVADIETLIDYFRWRQENSQRTALQQICLGVLKEDNHSSNEITRILSRLNYEQKLELLRQHGVSYKFYPMEYRLGSGVRWNIVEKKGVNPKTNQTHTAKRRILEEIAKLPIGKDYSEWLQKIIISNSKN